MGDALGDRMKLYESAEAGRKFMPLLPILARVDGRAFHSFTQGMARPFEPRLSQAMIDTAAWLASESNACMAYTQSDEITLAWYSTDIRSQVWFDGRIAKMTSQLAAQATLRFYLAVRERMPEYADRLPTFDARVWQVPNTVEGANAFLWREMDATKNSVSMAARAAFSHKQLHGKHQGEMLDMLHSAGINWNDYPPFFKRGTYLQRRTLTTPFTAEELETLPPKHAARTNPSLVVERSRWLTLDMPPFGRVANRADVIFAGAEPVVDSALSATEPSDEPTRDDPA